ncbi:MAG: hypothetical protein GC129_01290 [Proteobacteria bacterium]|nr:hypothetical protein [Pseudomonadota bacterium]
MRCKQLFLLCAFLAAQASLLALAHWQWSRYHQRLAQAAEFSARPPTTVTGTFANGQTVALTNSPNPQNAEQIGWRILTPLTAASGTLLIDRGWSPATPSPLSAPDFTSFTTSGTVTLQGIPQPFPQRHGWLHGPDITTNPKLLAFLNPSLITSATLGPSYLFTTTPTPGITVAQPPALPLPLRHLSYAIQWLAMAVILALLGGWAAFKPKAPPRRNHQKPRRAK